MRIRVHHVPQRSNRVLKLILGHFGYIVEEIVEVMETIGKVEKHFVREVIRVHSKESILINGKLVVLALVSFMVIVEFPLFAMKDEVRGHSEGVT